MLNFGLMKLKESFLHQKLIIYSDLKLFTGLAIAARKVFKLTTINVSTSTKTPTRQ